jgi:hypothetical protein
MSLILSTVAIAALTSQASFYGSAGTSEANVLLGASTGGFAVGAGYRRFVVDRVGPGLEGAYFRFGGRSQGQAMASLRLVPLSVGNLFVVVTGRAGRVFVSGLDDGWAAGGDAGVITFLSPNVGIELGYQVLRLFPGSFCDQFTSCTIHQPVLGLRVAF